MASKQRLIWDPNHKDCSDFRGFYHYGRTAMSKQFKTGSSDEVCIHFITGAVDCAEGNKARYVGHRSSSTASWHRAEYVHTPYPITAGFSYAEPMALTWRVKGFGDVDVVSHYKFSVTTSAHVRDVFNTDHHDEVIPIVSALSHSKPTDWVTDLIDAANEDIGKAVRARMPYMVANWLSIAEFRLNAVRKIDHWFGTQSSELISTVGMDIPADKWDKRIISRFVQWRLTGDVKPHDTHLTYLRGGGYGRG